MRTRTQAHTRNSFAVVNYDDHHFGFIFSFDVDCFVSQFSMLKVVLTFCDLHFQGVYISQSIGLRLYNKYNIIIEQLISIQ
jgi:hypothetical protein